MNIKVCGITRLADARFAAAAGVDYLGFIQFEGSPRFIRPNDARELIEWLYGPLTVGVFVNSDADAVNRAADRAGFDMVQLHGDESPETCAAIERPVIKALRVGEGADAETLDRDADRFAGAAAHLLLDTQVSGAWGGSGVPFDWSLAKTVAETHSVFLAGGLTPTNVADAIRTVRPFAVDVSSGIEEAPGEKDLEKIEQFFDAVRGVDA